MQSDPLKMHLYACVALLALCLVVILTGWTPRSSLTDNAPVSVRENPGSYTPVYGHAGWIPIPVAGGGYSSGK